MLEAGQQVGDYIIESELGGGGMAVVYRARHAVLETHHAVKVLRPAYRVDPEARRRFVDEARIQAAKLDHKNIVKVTNIIATAEVAALVMELVDPAAGGTLDAWIAARTSPPTAAEFRALAGPIIAAIGYAHKKGVIHRDLKPGNVLLSHDEDGNTVPKLTDFGIAKVAEAASGAPKKSTHVDARMGTVGYSSPEQVRKAKEVTPRSDVFSLGALLYELATLKPAFEGASDYDVMENIVHGRFEPVRKRVPAIEPAIAAAIEKALSPDPEARFASCEELAAALGSGTPRPAPESSIVEATPVPPPRGVRIALIGGALLVLGGGGAWLALRQGDRAAAPVVIASGGHNVAALPPDAAVADAQLVDAAAEASQVAISSLDVKGGLPKDVVSRILTNNLERLAACYRDALTRDPGFHGTVVVRMHIAGTGSVDDASLIGRTMAPDKTFESCSRRVLQEIAFPSSDNERPVVVEVILKFPSSAELTLGAAEAQGDLDNAIIRRYVSQRNAGMRRCYNQALVLTPGLEGTVMVQFTISANGTVAAASGTGMNPTFASCVASVIKSIEFPKPGGGGSVQVNYPFSFHPAEDASEASAPSAKSPRAAPVTPAPMATPAPKACDADALKEQGMDQINKANHAAALRMFEAALACKDDPYLRQLAFMESCAASDSSKAKYYYKLLAPAQQTKFAQICMRQKPPVPYE